MLLFGLLCLLLVCALASDLLLVLFCFVLNWVFCCCFDWFRLASLCHVCFFHFIYFSFWFVLLWFGLVGLLASGLFLVLFCFDFSFALLCLVSLISFALPCLFSLFFCFVLFVLVSGLFWFCLLCFGCFWFACFCFVLNFFRFALIGFA